MSARKSKKRGKVRARSVVLSDKMQRIQLNLNELTERVTVRFSPKELEWIHDQAAAARVKPGTYIRQVVRHHARQLALFPEQLIPTKPTKTKKR